jgi:hypothetical protein
MVLIQAGKYSVTVAMAGGECDGPKVARNDAILGQGFFGDVTTFEQAISVSKQIYGRFAEMSGQANPGAEVKFVAKNLTKDEADLFVKEGKTCFEYFGNDQMPKTGGPSGTATLTDSRIDPGFQAKPMISLAPSLMAEPKGNDAAYVIAGAVALMLFL